MMLIVSKDEKTLVKISIVFMVFDLDLHGQI